ncbi:MAG TPA: toll/interleukin-1 receptor domain-containing protein [Pyrinomonadaceae bacterium]|nr:toll/interleukin-1 receptor domain-containing protein [Pyrinomonadaceae bacterium]
MANPEHLKILKRGVGPWNEWRREHRHVDEPDLSGADFSGANLTYANLITANLDSANLSGAELTDANLDSANLSGANLSGAYLFDVNLSDADLGGADFSYTNLSRADLGGADLTNATVHYTTFADNDLSETKGLETVRHEGPSSIGVDTLYKSGGKIPEVFLRGCGVPDDFIEFIPSLIGARQAIQFYSCFISYSTRDEEFARRLYSRMRDEKLRVWFAPEEMKGGQKLYEQIERAIQLHDRLLLVLSESSIQSEWVMNEIQRARETEVREGRRKLFPISIVEFEKVKAWRRFDADTGRDLAKEVREYFIPDFSNWKEHDAFEKAFGRLLRDLRAEEARA